MGCLNDDTNCRNREDVDPHGGDHSARDRCAHAVPGDLCRARCNQERKDAGETWRAGIKDTIERARSHKAAGTDTIFLVGLKSREDLEAVAAETSQPMIIGGAGPDLNDATYCAGQRVRIRLQGHQLFAAAVQAVYATLKALGEGTPPKALTDLATAKLTAAVSRRDRHED